MLQSAAEADEIALSDQAVEALAMLLIELSEPETNED
jgi:hypothetical protein